MCVIVNWAGLTSWYQSHGYEDLNYVENYFYTLSNSCSAKWKGHLEGFLHKIVVIPQVEEKPLPYNWLSIRIRKEQTTFVINCTEPNHLVLMLHIYPHVVSCGLILNILTYTTMSCRSWLIYLATQDSTNIQLRISSSPHVSTQAKAWKYSKVSMSTKTL